MHTEVRTQTETLLPIARKVSSFNIDSLIAAGLVPDWLIRVGIRRLLRERLRAENRGSREAQARAHEAFVEELKRSPIAIDTEAANEQHYEVPTAFYQLCLGRSLKYSSGLWSEGVTTLDDAEEAMLRLTCERAASARRPANPGTRVRLGIAVAVDGRNYPNARITGVSNSATQRAYIEAECAKRGLRNLQIITCDMNRFDTPARFDRVVSVEMFEHMKNYQLLMANVARWLKPDGQLFVHVFSHRQYAYHFVARDASDWMARYFFTGGLMPSEELLPSFQSDLALASRWRVSGRALRTNRRGLARESGSRTPSVPCHCWRRPMAQNEARRWLSYWRVFFMACAELWRLSRRRGMAGFALPVPKTDDVVI